MIRKTILTMLCLSLSLMCFSEIAYSFEAIYECYEQLLQKYPNVETIKKQFGDGATWQKRTIPSPHDDSIELQIDSMEYPGIEIRTVGFTHEGEESYFISLLDVKKAGFVKFGGIDLGSERKDVIKAFGKPQQIDGNKLIYYDESEYMVISFIIENEIVTGMRFDNYLD